jgi:hypothetical protein
MSRLIAFLWSEMLWSAFKWTSHQQVTGDIIILKLLAAVLFFVGSIFLLLWASFSSHGDFARSVREWVGGRMDQ